MAKDVHVGDNVVVKCDVATNKDYQILLCDKGLHMIQHGFKDGWGQVGFHEIASSKVCGMKNYNQIVVGPISC